MKNKKGKKKNSSKTFLPLDRRRLRFCCPRQSFLHKSRHDHACRRVRGPGGRFLTKAELNQYRKQLEAQDPEGATAPAPLPGIGRSKSQVSLCVYLMVRSHDGKRGNTVCAVRMLWLFLLLLGVFFREEQKASIK